jgi:cell division protein FtsB
MDAAKRVAAKPAAPALEPVPARSFSGRLLALAVVVAAITVMLAPSVRVYLQQQGELNALRAELAEQDEHQRALQRQLDRWEDPAYVRQQARERIFLVMPGERRYLVRGGMVPEDLPEQGTAAAPDDVPWADALWDSVMRAASD